MDFAWFLSCQECPDASDCKGPMGRSLRSCADAWIVALLTGCFRGDILLKCWQMRHYIFHAAVVQLSDLEHSRLRSG